MRCKHCGTLLEKGSIYCPSCGEEVQLITEDSLDEELLSSVLKDEESTDAGYDWADRRAILDEKVRHRRRMRKRIITVCVCLAALIVAAVIVVSTARNHSESYMLQQANKYYAAHDYDEAMEYLDKILALNPDNPEALILSARICVSIKDYDRAETMALHYLDLMPESTDGYRTLLRIYDAQGRYDEILERSRQVTNPDLLAVFDEFLTAMPSVSKEGGSYEEKLELALSSAGKAQIYYTLDGSEPDEDSELYESGKPVTIEEEGDTVLSAVCIDAKGHKSRVLTETYTLSFPDAEAPEVSPAGGEFDEQRYIRITAEEGATIYYDWDDEPRIGGEEYYGSIRVPVGNHVLEVIAVNEYGKSSEVVKYNFIYYPPVVEEPEPEEDETEAAEAAGSAEETENTETTGDDAE